MAHLFVYGTLKRDGANHRVLEALGARLVGRARTVTSRTLVDLGPYPALLAVDAERDAAGGPVHGEVFAIDDGAIGSVDAFEGVPELYRREPVRVVLEDGATLDAFTYVFARPTPKSARVIASGTYDWTGRVLEDGAHPDQVDD